jgi:hypothetical protein
VDVSEERIVSMIKWNSKPSKDAKSMQRRLHVWIISALKLEEMYLHGITSQEIAMCIDIAGRTNF